MKILQVCPKFHHSVASGSTKVAYCLTKELAKRGHSVTIYASDMRDKYTKMDNGVEEINGLKVHRFRSIGTIVTREMKMFVTPTIITSLKNKAHSFDVIHIHEYRSFQNVIVHHYAKKYGVPYILQAHGSLPRFIAKQRLKLIYDVFFGYRLLRDASVVIALNQTESGQYREMGVPKEKIAIIPNGIDLSEYNNLPPRGCFRKKFDIRNNEKIVLYLGRIHRIKGIDILVKAFADIIKKLDDVKLVIVGPDDGYLDKIKFLIETKNLKNNVLITGPLYGRDKLEAYIDAEVYVLPSRYETFPMTVLEAIACGTPIILTQSCGLADFVEDNVGLICEPNPKALQDLMYKMLKSAKQKEEFRNNCKVNIKKFDIRSVVKRLEELYKEIVRTV